ncbi:uncharacterized protein LOC131887017 [Tigriopus californicus]|uniref:uncharacterized protein LOC131887017 n=1 Tax=Tigriopus californicus TaxID=6832 RepID=UPI0027DA4401|nr:uncharacterized protein LOC131887017 [Tigriopus californicus]
MSAEKSGGGKPVRRWSQPPFQQCCAKVNVVATIHLLQQPLHLLDSGFCLTVALWMTASVDSEAILATNRNPLNRLTMMSKVLRYISKRSTETASIGAFPSSIPDCSGLLACDEVEQLEYAMSCQPWDNQLIAKKNQSASVFHPQFVDDVAVL